MMSVAFGSRPPCSVAAPRVALAVLLLLTLPPIVEAQRTAKPVLHGRHWMAITGKPLGATAGARMFHQGGNAVDAAAAMLAATSTMWDVLSWGGETQALVYHPGEQRVIGVNALGVAPTGATPDHYRAEGHENFPPEVGPLSAVTPGTPGGLMTMLAEWGRLSLADVLQPSIEMAEGYPIEADAARRIRNSADDIRQWPSSMAVYFTHPDDVENPGPREGEVFRQPGLKRTLERLVEAEAEALAGGASRKEAIQAAYDAFYRGDIAADFVAGAQAAGALITMEDMANWQVHLEEPVTANYKGIDVYKLTTWVQGPVMLQALNMAEQLDLQAMGYNSANYLHALYQVMNLSFADRDFYYGDPYFPPAEPIEGLLSKDYARARLETIEWDRNDPNAGPGDPYPFQGEENPFADLLERWGTRAAVTTEQGVELSLEDHATLDEDFYLGTTSVQAADAEGWVVSITPSGGWIPAVVAGETGIGLSQRAQSFVLDEADNPYNVIEPGKRPRATLTPGMALKDGRPFLSFAVQGGDGQDQNLLQFFLNVVEWDMNVQQAVEAPNMNSFQMRGSFGQHETRPGRMLLQDATPPWIRSALESMGYDLTFAERTSGPINAIFFDWENDAFWGGSSHHGDDYGIAW
ncbi:gamma-glutamyltransferase [Candidatus Palauibacter polyketidifaciens]|uniref:gamma-glutamyltransferase family protein n=1 Tax=Candidatus Palauibacter polyketidifaciens TaxID=3056740 RepID=UPI00239109AD|nr:gamma-glutamyltransferase [Candidatus Palauibacter polyketidifaciens]MDE2719861.1 gamma-glutamyltransferase [Candidatus Palauibacter polyketidifaciens]